MSYDNIEMTINIEMTMCLKHNRCSVTVRYLSFLLKGVGEAGVSGMENFFTLVPYLKKASCWEDFSYLEMGFTCDILGGVVLDTYFELFKCGDM